MRPKPTRSTHAPPAAQRGIALLIALVILIGVTLLSVTAMTESIMELRMAGNAESSTSTVQRTMAAIDYVIANPANLPATGPLGENHNVTLSGSPFQVTAGDSVTATATRLQDCGAPPRMRDASSLNSYSSFRYEISATSNLNASGMGKSSVTQGYIVLGPKC